MSGQHAAGHRAPSKRHPNLVPGIVGAVVAVVLVGAAVGTLTLRPTGSSTPIAQGGPLPSASATDDRLSQDRADRGELRTAPSTMPATTTPASPTAVPTKSPTPGKKPSTSAPTGTSSTGTCGVSYYEDGSHTANGEVFDPNGLTAASRTLPFNTMVRVTNPKNGKSVVVRVNDRGPFVSSRCLDLARGAFLQISTVSAGVIPNAKYEVLK